jgi:hypothetical protein
MKEPVEIPSNQFAAEAPAVEQTVARFIEFIDETDKLLVVANSGCVGGDPPPFSYLHLRLLEPSVPSIPVNPLRPCHPCHP